MILIWVFFPNGEPKDFTMFSKCIIMFNNVLSFHSVLHLFHDVLQVFHNVLCFMSVSQCFMIVLLLYKCWAEGELGKDKDYG